MKNKKILMITTRPLVPNINGYTIRLFYPLKGLKDLGYKITLLSFCDESQMISEDNEEIKQICDKYIQLPFNRKTSFLNCIKGIFTGKPFKAEYYNTGKIRNFIKKVGLSDNFDYVCSFHYLTSQFLDMFPNTKRWIELCDAISMLHERDYKTQESLIKKIFLFFERKRVLKIEKHCIKNYDLVTLISESDKDYLNKYCDANKIKIFKNGTLIPDADVSHRDRNEICFIGDMGYVQNHEAAKFVIESILPEVEKNIPDIRFKIIGRNPKPELYKLAKGKNNIVITGFVENAKKELESANIMLCPIYVSAGLQNKILEAMSMGIPVITTKQVALPVTSNEEILLQADKIEDWVKIICKIYNDDEYRNKISANAFDFVKKNFSWESCINDLNEFLNNCSERGGK